MLSGVLQDHPCFAFRLPGVVAYEMSLLEPDGKFGRCVVPPVDVLVVLRRYCALI